MDFSVWPNPQWTWDDVRSTAVDAEAAGWHGVWFADHFMPNTGDSSRTDGDFLECWGVLAALAAVVPRVRLGPLVSSTTFRHPAVLANLAATVDHVSGGRLVLGLGAGWQINEHDAYGIPLGSVKERLDRFEEACQIVTSLLRDDRTTVEGSYHQVVDAPCEPKPVQRPLPFLVGAEGRSAPWPSRPGTPTSGTCGAPRRCSRTRTRFSTATARPSAATRRPSDAPARP
jgi:alkanesulfonate monooxygenase SsuD/methylene tetrahydromethanopterin reductase-like flavin-dependent oxidoreductase (luciferase family)